MNGYNFTERVRRVLAGAREEAAALHHEYVGTEHLLLGIIREADGIGFTVLQNLGVDPDDVRTTLINTIQRGASGGRPRTDLPYTSRAKRTLELSMSEARRLNHSYVGTEHLLLGLLLEEKGIAAMVLTDKGITVDKARAETVRILGDPNAKPRTSQRSRGGRLPDLPRRVREIIAASYDIAAGRNSLELTPVHVTIALLAHDGGMANAVLDRLEFDRITGLVALNELAPIGTTPVGPEDVVEMTPEMRTAIESMDECQRQANAPAAASHHMLLALLYTSVDISEVFAAQGITANEVLEQIRHISG